jgi:hypothetical protein
LRRGAKKIKQGVKNKVRPKMKRKENALEGCLGDNYVLERSAKEERLSKRCRIRSKVSREDTRSSGSRDK